MAQTHPSSETGAYREAIARSVGPGSYMTAADVFARPVSEGTSVSGMRVRPRGVLVDIDSDLMGITRKLGACVAAGYAPTPASAALVDVEPVDAGWHGTETRMNDPPCTLRGHGINRWQWLCEDPQSRALAPFNRPVDYRTVSKDNHRPIVPSFISVLESMPPAPEGAPSWLDGCDDIAQAVRDLPEAPSTLHWRDLRELKSIMGGRL